MTELEQKLYERGANCSILLDNPEVQSCLSEIAQGLLEAIAGTSPSDNEKRETYYNMHRGLQDLISLMTTLTQFKEQQDEQDETEDEFLSDAELQVEML